MAGTDRSMQAPTNAAPGQNLRHQGLCMIRYGVSFAFFAFICSVTTRQMRAFPT
jgi:hypothetical protein